MKTNYEQVKEFHEVFEYDFSKMSARELAENRLRLIEEEFREVKEILDGSVEFSKANLAKELSDLLYVVYGTADTFGIDIDEVFDKVHQSNLTKLDHNGRPIYREDGKILKGPKYRPPDLSYIE